MYEVDSTPRLSPRRLDMPTGVDPALAARVALARLRKLLADFAPGMSADPARLLRSLQQPFSEPAHERERLFAVGWLRWLSGEYAAAVPLLAEAERRCREVSAEEKQVSLADLPALEPGVLLARSAYWHARIRLLLDQPDAVADYEAILRKLGGSPQATAWYVDLIARAGKVDRAEQVWKSVRANKRVSGCDEGPLLDARAHLRRGELGPAEKLLRDIAPTSGVVWVERLLLLAWILAGQRQADRAAEMLQAARQGPYPAIVLDAWQAALAARRDGRGFASLPLPGGWREFVRAQAARAGGETSASLYTQAQQTPAVAPFARYGLVALRQDDAAGLLGGVQGLFFAVRLRARVAVDRFLRRELSPADFLDAMQQARNAGYTPPGTEHYTLVARLLQQRQPSAGDLVGLLAPGVGASERRNLRRAIFEASRRLSPDDVMTVLQQLARDPEARGDEALRAALGRMRFAVAVTKRDSAALDECADLLGDEPMVTTARHLLAGTPLDGDTPEAILWRSASGTGERERLEHLTDRRWRPLAVALQLHDAARRGDIGAMATLLEDVEAWRGFGAPPRFVVAAIESVAASQPGHPVWNRCLPGWLALWPDAANMANLQALSGASDTAPAGVEPLAWFSHQAARALQRGDAVAALSLSERIDTEVSSTIRPLALAQALASCIGVRSGESLAGLVDQLQATPEGQAVLTLAKAGQRGAVLAGLADLARRPDLPGRLYHHLALVFLRQAEDDESPSPGAWSLAWPAWLAYLGSSDAPPSEARDALLTHLLNLCRQRISDLLAASQFEPARLVFGAVAALPDNAGDLTERVERFRDELATEALVLTREVMRAGEAGEGMRADYERGLALLRRLLSLDGDNVRLLAAMVETCNDWFLDLYHLQDGDALSEQLDRHTPFALQLARRLADVPGQVAARAALSEFWMVRGFLESDPARKSALYREALGFNPGNANARQLLAEMGDGDEPESENA